jgi:hypothetical protein
MNWERSMKNQSLLLLLFSVAIATSATAWAQTAAPTTTTSRINEEPIVLPKLEAGRVTARVNEKAAISSAISRVEVDRVIGHTVVRVNPEGAPSYLLSNQQPAGVSVRRDQENLRIPQWQIGKF